MKVVVQRIHAETVIEGVSEWTKALVNRLSENPGEVESITVVDSTGTKWVYRAIDSE